MKFDSVADYQKWLAEQLAEKATTKKAPAKKPAAKKTED